MDCQAAAASAGVTRECMRSAHVVSLDGDLLNATMYEGLGAPIPPYSRRSGGPPSFVVAPHPLETQQKRYLHEVERQQLARVTAAFGAHAALRLKTEREVCATAQRLPGLPSSLWSLQVLMNLDDQILPEDYLNRDKLEEEGGPMLTVHDRIERAMGI
ncbi:hypothetical protein ACSSS7_000732 [Eimeria intestinalis]